MTYKNLLCVVDGTYSWIYYMVQGTVHLISSQSQEALATQLQLLDRQGPIHIFDNTSAQVVKIEKIPPSLHTLEQWRWIRHKQAQVRTSLSFAKSYGSLKQRDIVSVGLDRPSIQISLEEHFKNIPVTFVYHSYAFDLVRNLESFFVSRHTNAKYRMFVVYRKPNALIFALFQKRVLMFFRLINTLPQESLTYVVQETVRHLDQLIDTKALEIILCSPEDTMWAGWEATFPESIFLSGRSFVQWMQQEGISWDIKSHALDGILFSYPKRWAPLPLVSADIPVDQPWVSSRWAMIVFRAVLCFLCGSQLFSLARIYGMTEKISRLQKMCDQEIFWWKTQKCSLAQYQTISGAKKRHQLLFHRFQKFIAQMEKILGQEYYLKRLSLTTDRGNFKVAFSSPNKNCSFDPLFARWREVMKDAFLTKVDASGEELSACEEESPCLNVDIVSPFKYAHE